MSLSKAALTAAAVAIVIGVTPSITEAYENWRERPETRVPLVIWYALAVGVVWAAWRDK